ncbi:serine/threonine protein kinase [Aeromicrobium sp. A1-2]|uniref:protein kinase domain-containing protein n=1 Tax=Aeromicrobium sp. A1-2 TaxID=2107713 RepID=UPI000E4FD21E|nr:protein kinase [Aeromicrobium sp. A1-2]AXT85057.1 serine/threonine protein kinase [Aeromicrobium sp. A1-2]
MGELLNDRYELDDIVGSGGMGAVYRAHDVRLDRTVAVKVLRGGALADDVARSRMRSEAQLAASIHHPGVAEVYDYGENTLSHEGVSFIAMEYVEGYSLAQLLRSEGPMPVEQVMSIVVQVAEGLQATHSSGVVHRDLKPANIMFTASGRTVLVDFGIARGATSDPLTHTGVLLGTVEYLSPEQAGGRSATAQSDLYALGLVAHHCLTGTSPFRRESQIATALAQLNDELPPLADDVAPEVKQLIASLTAKNPSDRPQTAAAVAALASTIGASAAVELPATLKHALPALPESARAAPAQTPVATASAGPRRPRKAFLGVALLAAILAGLILERSYFGAVVAVPSVVGMDADTAAAELREAGMTATAEVVDVAGKTKGEVLRQSPESGAPVPDNGVVRLAVVSGKVAVSAKDLIGTPYARAAADLEKLGFVVKRKDIPSEADVGAVVALDRSGRLTDGSTITLSVALAQIPAPSVSAGDGTPISTSASSGSSSDTKAQGEGKAKGKAKGKSKSKK